MKEITESNKSLSEFRNLLKVPFSVKHPMAWNTGVTKGLNKQHKKVMRKIHNQIF